MDNRCLKSFYIIHPSLSKGAKMKAMDVAAHVVNRCIDLDMPVSNLKLQKMLYFLEINFLINFDKNLIDEDFEAWQYGPVLKEVYDKYSFFAASSIKVRQKPQNNLPNEYKNSIINNIDHLAKIDAWSLVEYSHKPDTPWAKTYCDGKGNHQKISKELLRKYAQNIKNEKKE